MTSYRELRSDRLTDRLTAPSPERNPPLPIPRLPPLRLCSGIAQLFAPADTFLGCQTLQHQLAGRYLSGGISGVGQTELGYGLNQAGNHAEALQAYVRPLVPGNLEGAALVEPGHNLAQVGSSHPILQHPAGRTANQVPGNGVPALKLPFVFQLQLAGD